jgi:tRNA G18 (ribose-2'-O)-methylase SpoU
VPAGDHIPGITEVDDPADPRLVDYARLTDVGHRVRREPADGVFIAEGATVLRRALDAGYAPRSLLLAPNRVEPAAGIAAEVAACGAPVFVAGPEILERLTGYHVHRGLLAAMTRRPLPEPGELLAGARRVVVCEDIVDHTNLGSVFDFDQQDQQRLQRVAILEDIVDHSNVGLAIRNAAAFGVDAVLLTPSCADPLYRRAIRTSMGTVFQIPWTRLSSWPGDIELLHEAGYVTAAMTLDEDAIPIDDLAAARHPRLALIFGSEGPGLRPSTVGAAQFKVRIPMDGGVDSLNIAAAAAVAFYATR